MNTFLAYVDSYADQISPSGQAFRAHNLHSSMKKQNYAVVSIYSADAEDFHVTSASEDDK